MPTNTDCKFSDLVWQAHYSSKHIYETRGALLRIWINFNPALTRKHMPEKVRDEITNPFLNFQGVTAEFGELICHFISYFIFDVITYPFLDLSPTMLAKGVSGWEYLLMLITSFIFLFILLVCIFVRYQAYTINQSRITVSLTSGTSWSKKK